MNYYKLFSINESYLIDNAELKRLYLNLYENSHPDKAKDPEDKKVKLEKSIVLNKAFKVLNNDYLRAIHILELNDLIFQEEELRSALSSEELEEIFENYQNIENNQDLKFLMNFEKVKKNEKKTLMNKIDALIQKKEFENITKLVLKLKYMMNLIDSIRVKIKNL